MTAPAPSPASRRRLILTQLLVLAAAAWSVLVWQARAGAGHGMAKGLTMGMSSARFLSLWVMMMVAMMFPTAAPSVLMFARVSADRRTRGQPFAPTWVFLGGYLFVWAAAGVLAYASALAADGIADRSPWLLTHAARLGGGVLILTGVYQLTALKQVCLAQCRAPRAFILSAWREGYGGALRMGVRHGLACLGCCGPLFALLLTLGMMNLAAMALLTALIFAEQVLPLGVATSRAAAAALVACGLLVLAVPAALPTRL